MQHPLQYPLTLNFKIAALAPQISVTDAPFDVSRSPRISGSKPALATTIRPARCGT